LRLIDGGYGYGEAPTVQIVGGGGSGAMASARIHDGSVVGFNITTAGSGYSSVPEVQITPPVLAEPILSLAASRVRLHMLVTPSGKYQLQTSANRTTWVSGGPVFVANATSMDQEFILSPSTKYFRLLRYGAQATAQTTNGFVIGLNLTEAGGGYFDPPAVNFTGGGGSGARATARVAEGVVTGFDVQNAGVGYSNVPQVIIDPPPTKAEISVSISQFKLTMILTPNVRYHHQYSFDLVQWLDFEPPFVAEAERVEREVGSEFQARFFRVKEAP
jgi:hypothetical protein